VYPFTHALVHVCLHAKLPGLQVTDEESSQSRRLNAVLEATDTLLNEDLSIFNVIAFVAHQGHALYAILLLIVFMCVYLCNAQHPNSGPQARSFLCM